LWAGLGKALEIRVCLLARNHLDVANFYVEQVIALGTVERTTEALSSQYTLALEIWWHLCEHSTDKYYYSHSYHSFIKWPMFISEAGNLQQSLQVLVQARKIEILLTNNNMHMARI
jgi:hypothetical protein